MIIFTITSDGYKEYTWNLWKHMNALKLNLTILCLDRESHDFFRRIALIPSTLYLMDGSAVQHKSPTQFGSSAFKRMNKMKVKALREYSQKENIDILVYLDSDIVVFHDFTSYITNLLNEEKYLWFQCDDKNELEPFTCLLNTCPCPNPCSGVICMYLNDKTRPELNKLFSIDNELWKSDTMDQDYIQANMAKLGIKYNSLSRELFPNGTLLKGDLFKRHDPYLIHFNYIVGSTKKQMIKSKNYWLLHL